MDDAPPPPRALSTQLFSHSTLTMGRDDDDNDDVGTDGGWVDLARAHPVRDYDPSVGGPQRGRRRCPPGRGLHAISVRPTNKPTCKPSTSKLTSGRPTLQQCVPRLLLLHDANSHANAEPQGVATFGEAFKCIYNPHRCPTLAEAGIRIAHLHVAAIRPFR